uniref:Uncharacterized protein n=1 Tax=Salix viminalis TaxID=40686 RepID=A0A6N2NC63_SALVM
MLDSTSASYFTFWSLLQKFGASTLADTDSCSYVTVNFLTPSGPNLYSRSCTDVKQAPTRKNSLIVCDRGDLWMEDVSGVADNEGTVTAV